MIFFWAYRQWFAWLSLTLVLGLPLFSLLVSLPAMLTAKLNIQAPDTISVNTPCQFQLHCRSVLPTPLWKCTVTVEHPLSGQRWRLKKKADIPTAHCGALEYTVTKARICDYLGLFSFPMRTPNPHTVIVRPAPVPSETLPQLSRYLARAWRPKRGGGFAENHELRLYRPGDSVQQIHWKLSAKTGKLILREPMEPERGRVLLRMDLNGTAAELDKKLGRLLWLGEHLLDLRIQFEVQCLTGVGCENWAVTNTAELTQAIDDIMTRECAAEGSIRDRVEAAAWQCYIGGGTDEV